MNRVLPIYLLACLLIALLASKTQAQQPREPQWALPSYLPISLVGELPSLVAPEPPPIQTPVFPTAPPELPEPPPPTWQIGNNDNLILRCPSAGGAWNADVGSHGISVGAYNYYCGVAQTLTTPNPPQTLRMWDVEVNFEDRVRRGYFFYDQPASQTGDTETPRRRFLCRAADESGDLTGEMYFEHQQGSERFVLNCRRATDDYLVQLRSENDNSIWHFQTQQSAGQQLSASWWGELLYGYVNCRRDPEGDFELVSACGVDLGWLRAQCAVVDEPEQDPRLWFSCDAQLGQCQVGGGYLDELWFGHLYAQHARVHGYYHRERYRALGEALIPLPFSMGSGQCGAGFRADSEYGTSYGGSLLLPRFGSGSLYYTPSDRTLWFFGEFHF